MWTSTDGLKFDHHSVSVAAKNIGTKNATNTRAYEYPLKRHGNRYIMLYSGFIVDQGIRCVWLAHSQDGESWTQETTPLVIPIAGENNDLYQPVKKLERPVFGRGQAVFGVAPRLCILGYAPSSRLEADPAALQIQTT